ncbi:DUF4280 domain-containing protein [Clostridium botulinum]|uniref:DUF4280 domain-containing protein n=1 Tax=Clostridium botulinum TaxID=1491 RepID=UPI0007742B43|nr:DUF4280 domain-containing protein [Clostridium botulinum]MBY6930120.1 DUF4280 domain-containing protein [Clostridium botulinum]NFG19312.1 DUF4280 domain-containing protein [Clostridium botulinum]NFO81461.1 DUF4280 domain-containing protein [Clostridium botulinum]NFS11775.1 DUF4280 domain-containing protein [Clostridium botulinum]
MSEVGDFLGSVAKGVIKETGEIINETVSSAKELGTAAVNSAKYLSEDIANAVTGKNEESSKGEDSKSEEEKPDPAFIPDTDECNARLKELENTYILHTAVILCSKADHESYLVVTKGHGEFIQGIPQLNVGDCVPNVNIRNFGICRSPKNPDVQEAAKEILDKVKKENEGGFINKVKNFFFKSSGDVCDSEESLAANCAGKCDPQIFVDEWPDGKEDVLIDGKPALLGKCKLSCGYDGEITIFTSGQRD